MGRHRRVDARRSEPARPGGASGGARGRRGGPVAQSVPRPVGAGDPAALPDETAPAAAEPVELFAACAPGLEPLVAQELRALGYNGQSEPGGVTFRGAMDALYRANLWLRVATRVTLRIAHFRARGFPELERHAARVDWPQWIARGREVRFRVACRKSRLYHSDAVAERLGRAVEHLAGGRMARARLSDDDEEAAGDRQTVVVRLLRDVCTISLDTSGDLLHRRGYRQATGKAPMRETLAAALIAASAWPGDAPLLDPFCGAGTIAIEAAWIARRLAPGAHRRFAFMSWPAFDLARWREILGDAARQALPAARAPILASDRDAGAVAAARENAERAGVASDVHFDRLALSAVTPPAGPGWLIANPPYGIRVGDRRRLRDLYARLGQLARRSLRGWTVALLLADTQLESQLALPTVAVLATTNGGVRVRIVTAIVPDA